MTGASARAADATPAPAKGNVLFVIEGVNQGMFQKAQLRAAPDPKEHTCAFLFTSVGDVHALTKWMDSNRSVGALASQPEATITVTQDGGTKLQYHLSRIEIPDFSEINQDGPIALERVEISCQAIHQVPVAAALPK